MTQSLAEIVGKAEPGSYIRLSPHEYCSPFLIDRPLTIVGAEDGSTVFAIETGTIGIKVSADTHIYGIEFRGSGKAEETALEIVSGHVIIEKCHFSNVTLAISIQGDGVNCEIRSCHVEQTNIGVVVKNGANVVVKDTNISNVTIFPLLVDGEATVEVEGCKFLDSKLAGVVVQGDSQAEFRYCEWIGSPNQPREGRLCDAQLTVVDGASVSLSECKIHDGLGCGVFVARTAKADLSDCEVARHDADGVEAGAARIDLRRCRMLQNGGAGILVHDDAKVCGENLSSLANKGAGVAALRGGSFQLRASQLDENFVGVSLAEKANGALIHCSLKNNLNQPTQIGYGCQLDMTT